MRGVEQLNISCLFVHLNPLSANNFAIYYQPLYSWLEIQVHQPQAIGCTLWTANKATLGILWAESSSKACRKGSSCWLWGLFIVSTSYNSALSPSYHLGQFVRHHKLGTELFSLGVEIYSWALQFCSTYGHGWAYSLWWTVVILVFTFQQSIHYINKYWDGSSSIVGRLLKGVHASANNIHIPGRLISCHSHPLILILYHRCPRPELVHH